MSLLDVVRADLHDASLEYIRQVGDACGVSYWTLLKIARGTTPNPRFGTIERLRAHYERKRRGRARRNES